MPPTPQDINQRVPDKNGTLDSSNDSRSNPNSTELDPCLNQNATMRKKQPFYEKYISHVQERTGFSRKWVFIVLGLVIGVIVLFCIVVGLAAGWPRVPHMYSYPVCRDSTCLRAAVQIRENLYTSISPCKNIWGAFCSSWAKNSTQPLDRPSWSQKDELVQKESQRIRDLVATLDLPVNLGSVEWKLKYLYESCLNVETLSMDNALPLTNIINELGGWYILRNWNYANFDPMVILRNLQVRYGVSPFFKVHVEPNPHVPNTYSIRISPSGLGLPDKEYYYSVDRIRTAYIEYIRDVIINLSSTKSEASKFGQDIFSYEKRIAEITPDRISLQNPITTYNALTLSELKEINLIPFFDILQAMYPEANISENTEVIVTSPEYLTQISQVIATTDRRTLNGYFIWTLVRKYIPFLTDNFISALDSFDAELFGITKPKKRWEICSILVKKNMGLAGEYLLENTHPISKNTKKIVNDTFQSILDVVKNRIKNFQDSALLYQQLETKLNTVTLQIGLPENITKPQFIKDYFLSLTIIKSNFFESVKNLMTFRKKIEEKMLLNSLPEGIFLKEYLEEKPLVKYLPSRNQVVVPRSLVMEPFFEASFPSPITYGRLGKEIAQALISSVLPYNSLWTAEKKILSPFHMTVNDSFKSIQTTRSCLARYILNLDVPALIVNETALTVLTELSAVSVANEALLAKLKNEDHVHYGGLEDYEDSALFFISYAQTLCSDATSQYQLYENIVKFRLSKKSLLYIAWSQLKDFQKAFDCSSDENRCSDNF